jgi:hypothetical protein
MPSADPAPDLFPELSREAILAFQFSAWYPRFRASSVKSTIIRPLSAAFVEYLNADGVVVPEGSEDLLVGLSSQSAVYVRTRLTRIQTGNEHIGR